MLELRHRVPRIVEPEDERSGPLAREIADLRVVAVDDEHAPPAPERARPSAPALRDVLELSVAVELVAEQVPEADRPGPDTARDLRQRGLVHLEEPQLRVPGGQEGGGDPGDEIRARSVVSEAQPRARGSPRPSPRSSSSRSSPRSSAEPMRKSRGKPVERVRVERGQHLARHGRSSAGADQPRELVQPLGQPTIPPAKGGGISPRQRTPLSCLRSRAAVRIPRYE